MTLRAILTDADREPLLARTRQLAEMAREEDFGRGDITGARLADQGTGRFRLVAKQKGVFAGREIAATVLDVYSPDLSVRWMEAGADGAIIAEPPQDLAELAGPVDAVLAVERVLLNFLQRLSGVATATRRYVDAVAGTNARILDTRKTTPGWRLLEKYAVRCGGGANHRMGLYDAILIKDNHLASTGANNAAAAVFQILNQPTQLDPPPKFVEVEADTLEQVEHILTVVGVDVVLLDNFSLDDLRRAVEFRRSLNLEGKVLYEASGGITLDTVADVAHTGVDHISVGAITHSAAALDIALERV